MSSLLIRNVQLNGNVTNILINGNRFHNLHAPADAVADETYDASGLAIVPSFFNTHTHASMTLLRGYADDLPLFPWLNDHIWPFEGKMRRRYLRRRQARYAGNDPQRYDMVLRHVLDG